MSRPHVNYADTATYIASEFQEAYNGYEGKYADLSKNPRDSDIFIKLKAHVKTLFNRNDIKDSNEILVVNAKDSNKLIRTGYGYLNLSVDDFKFYTRPYSNRVDMGGKKSNRKSRRKSRKHKKPKTKRRRYLFN
jgi:hypothetical protein